MLPLVSGTTGRVHRGPLVLVDAPTGTSDTQSGRLAKKICTIFFFCVT
jgi:hypothetical protein